MHRSAGVLFLLTLWHHWWLHTTFRANDLLSKCTLIGNCSTAHSISQFLAVTQSADYRMVANDRLGKSFPGIPSWLYSCIGWSSLINHLTDGVSFTLHCCWCRFVLPKTVAIKIKFLNSSTQRLWPVLKNDAIMTSIFRNCCRRS